MKDYTRIIELIDGGIGKFNAMLRPECAVPQLGADGGAAFMDVAGTPWDEQFWPNKDAHGVYFLFGYREQWTPDPESPGDDGLALYIGKASLAKIGVRLYSHLYPGRDSDFHRLHDASGQSCVIEKLATIDLSTRHDPALASALEEFLIRELRQDVRLINAVGNA